MIKTVSKFSDSAESLKLIEMEGQYPFYKNMSFSIYFMAIFFETSLETAFFFRNINFHTVSHVVIHSNQCVRVPGTCPHYQNSGRRAWS